jgi:hypothetical protein
LVRACGTAHIRFGDHRVDIRTDHRILLGAIGLIGADAADQVPCPAFLAIGGALIAVVPSSPFWTLEPDLALALLSHRSCSTPGSTPRCDRAELSAHACAGTTAEDGRPR